MPSLKNGFTFFHSSLLRINLSRNMTDAKSSKSRNRLFYVTTIAGLLAVIYFVIKAGEKLQKPINAIAADNRVENNGLLSSFMKSFSHPVSVFILQLILIIVVSRIFAYLFRKIGQPSVMGEIVAGILLGPSLMGTLFPAFSAFVFPAASISHIQLLSQVGLILFMFVVGMELDLKTLKQKAGTAVIISHASIVIPYGLGVALSYFLYERFAPDNIPFYAFALFMGIAMSITAFPVLARVIREKNLTNTRLGTIAITCAAADDITAWCILAAVIAIVKAGSPNDAIFTLLFAATYVAIMLLLVKPFLKKLADKKMADGTMMQSTLAVIFIVLLVSSYTCEIIGIHALFGAFMAGVVMPQKENFRTAIISKIEDVALVLLLPLFFVFTGLRTQIGLLYDSSLWGICLIIILVAVVGKFGGSALAARFTGETVEDSLAIGALMNTRGLVELVVLNIGYELKILTPEIFTMLVLMALVTTFMTSPLMYLIFKNKYKRVVKKP